MRVRAALLLLGALAACAPAAPPPATVEVTAHVAAPAPPPAAPSAPAPPTPPARDLDGLRDPRMALPPRPRALLVTEIQSLESMLEALPPEGADRPAVLRRIADRHDELARAAEREGRTNADLRSTKLDLIARNAALGFYAQIAQTHPDWCAAPDVACIDETLYFMARDYEELGRLVEARQVYVDLVKDHPQSKYVPLCYLSFGELFAREAQDDAARWPLARQSFEMVLKYPAPRNWAYGYALLRLGEIDARLGRADEARARFAELRDLAARMPNWPPAVVPARLAPAAP
jgi:TolA-binding protein